MDTKGRSGTEEKAVITDETIAGLRAGDPKAIATVQTVTIEKARSLYWRRKLGYNEVARDFAVEQAFVEIINYTYENLQKITAEELTEKIEYVVDNSTQKAKRIPANLEKLGQQAVTNLHVLPPDLRLERMENCRRFHLVVETVWEQLQSLHPRYFRICKRILHGSHEGPFTPAERRALNTFRTKLIQVSRQHARRLGAYDGASLMKVADYLHDGIGPPRNLVRGYKDLSHFIKISGRQEDS